MMSWSHYTGMMVRMVPLGIVLLSASPSRASDSDETKREAAIKMVAEGAAACRRNLQDAPQDLRLSEVGSYCQCMGIQETALQLGGVAEGERPQMRGALSKMCVNIINKSKNEGFKGELNSGDVLKNISDALKSKDINSNSDKYKPAMIGSITDGIKNSNNRSAYYDSCLNDDRFIQNRTLSERKIICGCIADKVSAPHVSVTAVSVTKFRDACLAKNETPPFFGSWKMSRDPSGKPIGTASMKAFRGVPGWRAISIFCVNGDTSFRIDGINSSVRSIVEKDSGDGDNATQRYHIETSGIFDRKSSIRLKNNLTKFVNDAKKSGNIKGELYYVVGPSELSPTMVAFDARGFDSLSKFMSGACK